MGGVKREVLTWLRFLLLLATWYIVASAQHISLNISIEDWKTLPETISVYLIITFALTKWVWRFKYLQGWLVRVPVVEGTWQGTLASTYEDPATGKIIPPKPIILVIKQSFDSISCIIRTEESDSYSLVASVTEDDESGEMKINYVYINTPRIDIRGRSPMHYGAAVLKIVERPERRLEGNYWTDRKTTGALSLEFRTKERLGRFPDDLKEGNAIPVAGP